MPGLRHLLIALLILPACNSRQGGEATITGRLQNGASQPLVLRELLPDGTTSVDSTTVGSDGFFSLRFRPGETGFYLLMKPGDGRVIIPVTPGDRLNVEGDYRNLPYGLTISGSEDAVLMNDFFQHSILNMAASDSLQQFLSVHQYDPEFAAITLQADSLFRRIWDDQRATEINFLEHHSASIASLIVVNFSFGPRAVLSLDSDVRYYRMVDSALSKRYPNNPHVLLNRKRIEESRPTPAPVAGGSR